VKLELSEYVKIYIVVNINKTTIYNKSEENLILFRENYESREV